MRLLAATKYVDVAQMALVRDAGLRLVGENRAEDLVQKWERYHDDLEFHFIGHLQRRKARLVVPRVTLIHSVESLSLVRELHSRALGPIDVLLEVNVSGEESKYGILPGDAEAFMKESAPYDSVRFTGLMTMAPIVRDPEDARPVFQRLRELRDQLAPRFAPCHPMTELSMGMSNDYAVAVEEGATIVRLGSTLFARAQGG
ncbi:MAG: YggS family pyridoxal phosphate-dependent enzyme [Thermoleophilia bacterium]|nr:YggS family pyridoxal phosphate-dependent enzyme [Thermoleophilia bacterium]